MPSSAITFGPTGPPERVVLSGRHNAESELKKFENFQDFSDRHEGWRYLIDRTNLKAGTDPAEATRHRQAELKNENQKLCGRWTLRPFLRHIVRDETRFPGKQIREQHLQSLDSKHLSCDDNNWCMPKQAYSSAQNAPTCEVRLGMPASGPVLFFQAGFSPCRCLLRQWRGQPAFNLFGHGGLTQQVQMVHAIADPLPRWGER